MKTTLRPRLFRIREIALIPLIISLLCFQLRAVDEVSGEVEAEAGPHPLLGGAERVLFLGDSITQNGRYIAYLHTALMLLEPEAVAGVEWLNLGLSSETASGLSEDSHPFPRPHVLDRVDSVLEHFQPQITFVCYGMNDAIYHPRDEERFEAYRSGIRQLVEKLNEAGSLVVLMTPPPFDAASSPGDLQPADAAEFGYQKPYRGYSEVLQELGWWILSQHEGVFATVDLYEPLVRFIEIAREDDADFKFGDGVHPGPDGHLVMALSILDALDVPLPEMPALAVPPAVDGRTMQLAFASSPRTLPPFHPWPTYWDLSPFSSGPELMLPEGLQDLAAVTLTETREGQEPVSATVPVVRQRAALDLAPELPVNQRRAAVFETLWQMHQALSPAAREAAGHTHVNKARDVPPIDEARATAAEQRRQAATQAAPIPFNLVVTPAEP